MISTFTITSARNAGEKPNTHPKAKRGSMLVRWYLKLADSEAGDEDVYVQKQPGNDLAPGMEITGRLEKGEYGWRLFPESQQGNFKAPAYQRENGDERSRRIERQHSQEMAIRTLALFGDEENFGEDPQHDGGPPFKELLVAWTDFFQQDLDAEVGGDGQGPDSRGLASSPTADMSAEASPQLKGKATQLLNKAGLAEGARKAVILFRCGTLKNPPKGRVQSLVTDLEQGATAEALLAEISDAWGNGDEVAAEAVKLIPPGAPVDTEGLPELDAEGKQILGIKDESDVPF